jgi:hypothetical protein
MPRAGISVRLACLAAASSLLSACHGRDLELTSVSPQAISARGGEALILRGSGFEAGVEVHIGDARVKPVEVVSESEIQITTPPLYAGPATISVATSDGAHADLQVDVNALDLRFAEAPPFALSWDLETPIAGVAMGDFDGDGDPDLVTCAASCRLLRNDGRGNFADAPAGKSGPRFPDAMLDTRVLAAADFDGDGALDVFLGLASEGPGVIYRNNGVGTFTSADADVFAPIADPVTAVAAGDIDGDGRTDLVIADGTADTVPLRVYLNHSKGGAMAFTLAESWAIPERDWIASAISLVDVDGDGALDLVLATPNASDGVALRLLLRHDKGFDDATARLPGGIDGAITAIAAGDVNGDGAPDIIAVGAGQDRLLLNDGSGHFFDATIASMPLDAAAGTSVSLVDLNRDRHPDLVIGNAGAETRLYLNDGTGRFLDHTPLLPIRADQTIWVAAANVDGDADEDLLILNAPPAAPRLYLSVEPSPHDGP